MHSERKSICLVNSKYSERKSICLVNSKYSERKSICLVNLCSYIEDDVSSKWSESIKNLLLC